MTNSLCMLIEKCKNCQDGNYPNSVDYDIKPLSLNEYKGFMVFSKETYTQEEINKFDNKNKFENYKYKHRYYALYKITDKDEKTLTFILYNPSSANPEQLDATISKCIELAKKNDYGNVEILNLFSLRQTNSSPKVLNESNSINSQYLKDYLKDIQDNDKNHDIVVAWGCGKDTKHKKYCNEIRNCLKEENTFYIGIDVKKINQQINRHPDPRVWNALGKFDEVAKLEQIKNKKYKSNKP